MWLVTQTVYNAQGQVDLTTDQYQEGSSAAHRRHRDDLRFVWRAVQTIRLQGVQVALVDANTGQPVNPLESRKRRDRKRGHQLGDRALSTKTVYNKLGQVTEIVAADGEVTSYEYDPLGQQIATIGQPVNPASVGITFRCQASRMGRHAREPPHRNDLRHLRQHGFNDHEHLRIRLPQRH